MPSRTRMGKVRGKKNTEGGWGVAQVVPGPFWGRRTQTLILNALLRFLVTGEPRTRLLSPSLKGVKQGSCLAGDGRKEDPRLFG